MSLSEHRSGGLLSALLVVALFTQGCVTATVDTSGVPPAPATAARDTHEQLHAVLWVQTAAEYRALALQAFNLAAQMMDHALADRSWSAATEQTGNFASLPPAVIVDVDETVLDNSAYQARLVRSGQSFSSATWTRWVEEEQATATPGALEFALAAQRKGVTVFYVTNRKAIEKEQTRRNLQKLGFPMSPQTDVILVRGERPEWSASDKTPRRSHIASSYRILLQIGDNIGDFIADESASIEERFASTERYRAWWGTRWIMLPNPAYGHWEAAALDHRYDRPDAEQLRIKRGRLDTAGGGVD
ncbi:MAG TPA: 5'-nucleotidase, lipoprotein e(P4) family [Thermoanaerobaculia bacterium]|nr:5'-nucleotidase, lipoprotein e(P4) family [Thermoanaerobaculia bacterium]